jgi:hypothetical protein
MTDTDPFNIVEAHLTNAKFILGQPWWKNYDPYLTTKEKEEITLAAQKGISHL